MQATWAARDSAHRLSANSPVKCRWARRAAPQLPARRPRSWRVLLGTAHSRRDRRRSTRTYASCGRIAAGTLPQGGSIRQGEDTGRVLRHRRLHPPMRPYQRVMDSDSVLEMIRWRLEEQHRTLNSFDLIRRVEAKLKDIFSMVSVTSNVRQHI